jgi:hypothetical protein
MYRELFGGDEVAKRKRAKNQKKNELENLKWEVADDLNLTDDLSQGGDELSVREAGKIGGKMVKKLVEKGKEVINQENSETRRQ